MTRLSCRVPNPCTPVGFSSGAEKHRDGKMNHYPEVILSLRSTQEFTAENDAFKSSADALTVAQSDIHTGSGWGSTLCTCSFSLEHSGGETGAAETHSVEGQDSEDVVDVGWQFEVSCRLGSRDLGEIVPVARVVQRVLILDLKFWKCCTEVTRRVLSKYVSMHCLTTLWGLAWIDMCLQLAGL